MGKEAGRKSTDLQRTQNNLTTAALGRGDERIEPCIQNANEDSALGQARSIRSATRYLDGTYVPGVKFTKVGVSRNILSGVKRQTFPPAPPYTHTTTLRAVKIKQDVRLST